MMANNNNLLMLSCPACGGKNKIAPSSTSIVCSYCGISYMVAPEIIKKIQDSFYACPKCHQADHVEKVSSIILRGVTHTDGFSFSVTSLNPGRLMPNIIPTSYHGVQSSDLAKKLNNPPKPPPISNPSLPKPIDTDRYYRTGRDLLIISVLILGIFMLCGVFPLFQSIVKNSSKFLPTMVCVCSTVVGLLFFIPLLITGFHRYNLKNNTARKNDLDQRYKKEIEIYNQKVNENAEKQRGFQKAINNWNNLYYCYRDDCVFVPGSEKFASSEQFQNYLYEI
jgi:hypothetical protein